MDDLHLWGPLAPLIGTWEGNDGLDIAFHNVAGTMGETPFRERTTFVPYGPVVNGAQSLYGLDYRTAAWRGDEELPFHTEIGAWLWDADTGHVMRCFVVPRGTALLAGAVAGPDDRTFTMKASEGSSEFGILSSPYLAREARTVRYECTVTVHDDGSYSYEETTVLDLKRYDGDCLHVDKNTLRRVE